MLRKVTMKLTATHVLIVGTVTKSFGISSNAVSNQMPLIVTFLVLVGFEGGVRKEAGGRLEMDLRLSPCVGVLRDLIPRLAGLFSEQVKCSAITPSSVRLQR